MNLGTFEDFCPPRPKCENFQSKTWEFSDFFLPSPLWGRFNMFKLGGLPYASFMQLFFLKTTSRTEFFLKKKIGLRWGGGGISKIRFIGTL